MASRQGFEKLTVELQDLENQFRVADQISMKMSENIRKASGVNEEEFQAYVESQHK